MGNINYDSFYKFLVSLGIIIVIIPFATIIFLFTESFDLQIAEEELVTYTETAQRVLKMKQEIPLIIGNGLTWIIFLEVVLLGVFLIVKGLKSGMSCKNWMICLKKLS